MARTRKRKVQLPALSEPEFLSLVDKPANRTGFKMIRSEDGELVKIRRRLKRTDQNLLSIDLPDDVSREAAESLMDLFGMRDEYEIVGRSVGAYTLRRISSDKNEAPTVAISLGEGIIANVATEAFSRAEGSPDYERETTRKGEESYNTYTEEEYGDGFTLARLVFTTNTWNTVETVREWLQRNDIDFLENGVEVTDSEIVVSRCDVEAEGYRVPIAEGVVGVLELSEKQDIPKSIHKTVLANLLEPFSEKQERSDKPNMENEDMPKHNNDATENAALDDSGQAARNDAGSAEQAEAEPMTREIVTEIAAAAVEAALATRFDKDKEQKEGEQKDEATSVAAVLQGLADKVDTLGSSIEGIRKDVDELGDTTVTRPDESEDESNQRSDDQSESVFAGMFSRG